MMRTMSEADRKNFERYFGSSKEGKLAAKRAIAAAELAANKSAAKRQIQLTESSTTTSHKPRWFKLSELSLERRVAFHRRHGMTEAEAVLAAQGR